MRSLSDSTPSINAASICHQQVHTNSIQFGIPPIDSTLPTRGLQRGALHEVFYDDPLDRRATASTLPALLAYNSHASLVARSHGSRWGPPRCTPSQHSSQHTWLCDHHHSGLPRILWIGKRSWPAPPALAALTATDPTISESLFAHSLFIDPPNDSTTLWAIDLALRSAAVDLIIAACPTISRTTTQRLSLAAQKYSTTAILLRSCEDRSIPSCASSRWLLSPTPSCHEAPSWKLSLLKLRGGLLLHGEWIVTLSTADLFALDHSTRDPLAPTPAPQSFTPLSALPLNQNLCEEQDLSVDGARMLLNNDRKKSSYGS